MNITGAAEKKMSFDAIVIGSGISMTSVGNQNVGMNLKKKLKFQKKMTI